MRKNTVGIRLKGLRKRDKRGLQDRSRGNDEFVFNTIISFMNTVLKYIKHYRAYLIIHILSKYIFT